MNSDDDLVRRRAAGRWLRTTRERRGFPTGEALAQRLGVTPGVISRYETGASKISDERAEQIAEALNLDIITARRNLGLWVPDDSAGTMDRAEAMMDENERLIAEILALPPREQQTAKAAVKAVIDALKENAETPDANGGTRR